jgi:FKBP-type peptidyl-prolyl cis-trans isomerase FkpA
MRTLFLLAVTALFAFQTACKKNEIKTEHGHRFINHTNNSGEKVKPGETAEIFLDVFLGDSMVQSIRRDMKKAQEFTIPTTDQMPKKVPGFIDGIMLMTAGDSATVWQALDSAEVKSLEKQFPDVKEVRFEIKVMKVVTEADKAQKKKELEDQLAGVKTSASAVAADYTAGKLTDKLTVLPSGVKLMVMEQGTGEPIKQGEQVETMYYGMLTNGTSFDDSFSRGEPLGFAVGVGQMIPGFDEGVQKLNHGGKAYVFIPYQLAYGEEGRPPQIPPRSELIFYIEVL